MRQLILVLLLCTGTAIGQAPPVASNPLIVHFQVQPKKGQPATDLNPADIEIREDGKPQPIVLFQGGRARPRALPVHIDLLFDCERRALGGVPLELELLQKHLLNAHENVAIGIYGFSGGPVRLTEPTRDPARLKKALDAAVFPRAASMLLFDQIQSVVLDAASAGPAIRMLVIFSSAQPGLGGSRSSEKELFEPTVRIAQTSGVAVYPVLLRLPFGSQASDSNSAAGASARGGPSSGGMTDFSTDQPLLRSIGDFNNLGSATGGHSTEALSGTSFLPEVLQWISKLIEDDYVAGFNPSSTGSGKRHKVQVVLRDQNRGKIVGGSISVVH